MRSGKRPGRDACARAGASSAGVGHGVVFTRTRVRRYVCAHARCRHARYITGGHSRDSSGCNAYTATLPRDADAARYLRRMHTRTRSAVAWYSVRRLLRFERPECGCAHERSWGTSSPTRLEQPSVRCRPRAGRSSCNAEQLISVSHICMLDHLQLDPQRHHGTQEIIAAASKEISEDGATTANESTS